MAQPASEQIIDLGTADLAELSERDLKSWVSHVVVHAMLGTQAGPLIDRTKLQRLIEHHFNELLVADRFDFSPLLAALLRIQGVQESDLYAGIVSLMGQLASMNIKMDEPVLRLTPLEKSQLIDDAYNHTQQSKEDYQASRLRRAVREFRTQRLGELLLENGLIDDQQLTEGLEAQDEMGGRLGSNLVRMGYIDEAQLASFLGRQLGLPCLTKLERVSSDAVRRVPKSIAIKYQVVPISVNDRDLGLAMADPANLEAIDAVSFSTGLRVRPAVAPEVLIEYALARFYGVRNRVRLRRLDLHRAKTSSTDLTPGQWAMSLDLLTADVGEEVVAPTIGPGADDLGQLALDFSEVKTSEDVLVRVSRYMAEAFATSAVFEVDGTHALGFSMAGVPASGTSIREVQVDVHQHPVLSDVFLRRGLFIGAEPVGQVWLTNLLGLPKDSLLTVMPLLEHEHVVALLVGNARRKPAKDPVVEDQTLAQLGSTALSMVALRRSLITTAMRRNPD